MNPSISQIHHRSPSSPKQLVIRITNRNAFARELQPPQNPPNCWNCCGGGDGAVLWNSPRSSFTCRMRRPRPTSALPTTGAVHTTQWANTLVVLVSSSLYATRTTISKCVAHAIWRGGWADGEWIVWMNPYKLCVQSCTLGSGGCGFKVGNASIQIVPLTSLS